ncbi:MAG: Ig-like domain-containing protein [Ruminiclostridium sp.]|nr:Ig-like domain-containing protein [Ruminiclostridium sp.]
MKLLKKLTALFAACVMAMTCFVVNGAAADDCFDIDIGSSRTDKLAEFSKIRYLFESDKSCELTVDVTFTGKYLVGVLVGDDEDGNIITEKPVQVKSVKGQAAILEVNGNSGFMVSNDEGNTCSCRVKYKISKGTHLLTFSNESDQEELCVGGKLTVKLSASKESAALDRFTVSLSKGDTLKLGALLSDGTAGKVKWSSSKKSVASVNSKGKITAKSKGTTVITASDGNQKISINIIVS